MDKLEIIAQLRSIMEDYLRSQNLELVDIIYRHEGKGLILRILADRPEGGISLGECARLNKELGLALDEKDVLKQSYVLEVSSPGIDRPLITRKDYLRCLNKEARFFFKEKVNDKFELAGVINKVTDDKVYIEIDGNIVEVPISNINRAKQTI